MGVGSVCRFCGFVCWSCLLVLGSFCINGRNMAFHSLVFFKVFSRFFNDFQGFLGFFRVFKGFRRFLKVFRGFQGFSGFFWVLRVFFRFFQV